jgi:putative peptidoglycan lipid II flippase
VNLFKALVTVSGMTLISRVFGFLRDAVTARVFGAGLYTDAFFVAFKLPNLLRRVFGEGAFSQAFVPILAEYKARRGEADTRAFVDHVSTLLALALLVVTVAGILAAPLIIYITAPGFASASGKFDLTVQLLRVTFPYILFISLTSLASGITEYLQPFRHSRVHANAAQSVLHCLCSMAGALVRPANRCVGMGGVRRWLAATGVPAAAPVRSSGCCPPASRFA